MTAKPEPRTGHLTDPNVVAETRDYGVARLALHAQNKLLSTCDAHST
jgi:hypothetical protein